MMLGYATYYLTRLSFSFVGPVLRNDLGLSMLQIGAVSSIFPLAYMNSKFIAGVLSDLLGSPKIIFALGLMLTGVMNLGFACGSTVPWFTVFWIANGLFQGCGGTPCGKMLVNWYPASIRGKWWSGWNASSNIGGFCIPLLAGGIAARYGWRLGMAAPGCIALVMGLVCLLIMNDSPEKIGLPKAEAYAAAQKGLADDEGQDEAPAASKTQQKVAPAAEDRDEDGASRWKALLTNKFLWCMAVMHFFVYFMRQGVVNWAQFYIMEENGIPAVEATARVSGFEFGGLLGCITSGQVSDYLISKNPNAGAAGMRARVMFAFALITPIGVMGLWWGPPLALTQWLSMVLFGFSIYGPQTLITMTGVETVPRRVAATAGGLLAYPAQLGSMFAGLPFAFLVSRFGWRGYFPALIVISVLSALSVLPGWNALSHQQKKARQRALASA